LNLPRAQACETACINSQTSDSKYSFATISAFTALRTLPPQAAMAFHLLPLQADLVRALD
jgi:hypothetical protein